MRIEAYRPWAIAVLSVLGAYPVVAQQAPQSILPPGFGAPQPPKGPPPAKTDLADSPVDILPTADTGNTALAPPDIADLADNAGDNATDAVTAEVDIPDQARRSLDRVGLTTTSDSRFAADAFGDEDGRFLAMLMHRVDAPLASRWASILLRRALIAATDTPAHVDGADWAAERAWLLVRMGEADNARSLIQRVDADRFTPWTYVVAMQAALSAADPVALCAFSDEGAQIVGGASWTLARAMCAGLSGDTETAAGLFDHARRAFSTSGIDLLLAEKVAGAGTHTRRAITIQWDAVDQLDAWRYGLAAATGVAIPPNLWNTVGPQTLAWAARAPLYPLATRLGAADRAATLGVFSSAALVDAYSAIFDDTDPSERSGTVAGLLREAYADQQSPKVEALRGLWGSGEAASLQRYARLILTARASAALDPTASLPRDDRDRAIAAMMSAGLDLQAARWRNAIAGDGTSLGWALLAVGAPRGYEVQASQIDGYASDHGERSASLLYAALAGLGRISAAEKDAVQKSRNVVLDRQSTWTRALDRAVARGEPATVVLICAAGLQTRRWETVPPEHLYRIVASLSRVGLGSEARMIAAEALTRT